MDAINFADLAPGTKRSLKLDVVPLADGSNLSVPVNVIVGSAAGPCLV
jgi:hypothetical protein